MSVLSHSVSLSLWLTLFVPFAVYRGKDWIDHPKLSNLILKNTDLFSYNKLKLILSATFFIFPCYNNKVM